MNEEFPIGEKHVGEFLREVLKYRSVKHIDLAGKLGIDKSVLSLIINGKRKIGMHLALDLEKVLEIKADLWIMVQVSYELNQMRKKRESEKTPSSTS